MHPEGINVSSLTGRPRTDESSEDFARRISLILMSLAGLSQGFIGPIVKLVNFAPLPLVVGRCAVAAVILHAICALTGRRIEKADRVGTIICGLLLVGHFGTLFMAYTKTDVNLVLIALFTSNVYVIGQLTRGRVFYVSAIERLVLRASVLAADLLSPLRVQGHVRRQEVLA